MAGAWPVTGRLASSPQAEASGAAVRRDHAACRSVAPVHPARHARDVSAPAGLLAHGVPEDRSSVVLPRLLGPGAQWRVGKDAPPTVAGAAAASDGVSRAMRCRRCCRGAIAADRSSFARSRFSPCGPPAHGGSYTNLPQKWNGAGSACHGNREKPAPRASEAGRAFRPASPAPRTQARAAAPAPWWRRRSRRWSGPRPSPPPGCHARSGRAP